MAYRHDIAARLRATLAPPGEAILAPPGEGCIDGGRAPALVAEVLGDLGDTGRARVLAQDCARMAQS